MGGMVNLTSFALLAAVISLSQFFSFIENHKNTIVEFFFLLFEQNGNAKNIFVVLSHSLLFKLTQLWRLPLLRNPEMWKRSINIDTALSEKLRSASAITDYLLQLLEMYNVSTKEAFQVLCFGMH